MRLRSPRVRLTRTSKYGVRWSDFSTSSWSAIHPRGSEAERQPRTEDGESPQWATFSCGNGTCRSVGNFARSRPPPVYRCHAGITVAGGIGALLPCLTGLWPDKGISDSLTMVRTTSDRLSLDKVWKLELLSKSDAGGMDSLGTTS